jgi:hypothetical protein
VIVTSVRVDFFAHGLIKTPFKLMIDFVDLIELINSLTPTLSRRERGYSFRI